MNSCPAIIEIKPTEPKQKKRKRFFVQPINPPMETWEVERQEFVCLPRLPAILNSVQACWLLGFTEEAISILVRERILEPLGGAGPNDCKRFSSAYILQLALDRKWLEVATNAVYQSRTNASVAQ